MINFTFFNFGHLFSQFYKSTCNSSFCDYLWKGTASTGTRGEREVFQRSPIFPTARTNLAQDSPLAVMQQLCSGSLRLGKAPLKRDPNTSHFFLPRNELPTPTLTLGSFCGWAIDTGNTTYVRPAPLYQPPNYPPKLLPCIAEYVQQLCQDKILNLGFILSLSAIGMARTFFLNCQIRPGNKFYFVLALRVFFLLPVQILSWQDGVYFRMDIWTVWLSKLAIWKLNLKARTNWQLRSDNTTWRVWKEGGRKLAGCMLFAGAWRMMQMPHCSNIGSTSVVSVFSYVVIVVAAVVIVFFSRWTSCMMWPGRGMTHTQTWYYY